MNYYTHSPYYPVNYPYHVPYQDYRNFYSINPYYTIPYFNYLYYSTPTYPINKTNYIKTKYPSNRQGLISLQNNANTQWKDHYLDIDGNTGQVILWPRLGSGGYWKFTDHGDGTVSLQNNANTQWKDHYLDIDGNTGQVILWPRLGSGGYWKFTDHGDGTVSLQNNANTQWKDHYLDIDGNTGQVILWPRLGSGGYWKFTGLGNDTDGPGSQDCSVTGGKGKKLDSDKIGIGNILELEYIIYECAIEVKPGIAGINTGGTYTLSATQKGVRAIWPIVPEVSRYVFSVYVENKTLWVELEMQHRTLQGLQFVWRKTWGTKTKVGSWANLKF
ncbi:hypothetical protein CN309_14715 [Bacillus thuringiensis]|uniref:hypothetical protein n=1 Tax=Bacillus thuringiensis TaxID=1428 RepID=UPI000BFAA78F|nr:hypothetical protein [Bacillus thuringiensis]PFD64926.1 hypothetical protein CN309_14715 [Bacillus thuringiensis]